MCRVEGYVPNAGRHRQRPGPVEKCNTCRDSEKEGSLVVSADVLSAQQNFLWYRYRPVLFFCSAC